MAIRMVVAGLAVDPGSKAPMVVLKEEGGDRAFPIWIGLMEASAIAAKLEETKVPRPMTHDLLAALIDSLGGRVDRIVVSELRGNTFYALLHIDRGGEELVVDARPSDAIALALRTDAPIFVEQQVLDNAHQIRIRKTPEEDSAEGQPSGEAGDEVEAATSPRPLDPNTPPEKWTEILENLDPEAFGKYKM